MYLIAIFSPLLGSILAGTLSLLIPRVSKIKRGSFDRAAQVVTIAAMLIASLAGTYSFIDIVVLDNPNYTPLFTWVNSGDLSFEWALRGDTLSVLMVLMVTWISTMIHIYSVGYMSHDKSIPRFMSYLSLFTFFMLMLVTSNNLIQLFFGWEGVGLASYLLIGFWYEKPSACAAAIKAFVVNRVGDFGFALGIFATFMLFGS